MPKCLLIVLLSFSSISYGQMTLPSAFPDMRSVNPAVIPLRRAGDIMVGGELIKVDREQKMKTLNGQPFVLDEDSKTSLTSTNVFYGGAGGGLTSEIFLDSTSGERESVVTDGSGNDTTYTTDTSAQFFSFAFGAGGKGMRWGLGTHYVNFGTEYGYSFKANGQEQKDEFNSELTAFGVRPGIIFGSPAFSLGLYLQYDSVKTKRKGNTVDTDDSSSRQIVGTGIGTGGPNGILEIAAELDLSSREKDPSTGDVPPAPQKFSLLIERRFERLTLGYKGMMYKGNFMDMDQIIHHQLIYSNIGSDTRLQHVFNFTWGRERGITLGVSGGVSSSKAKEKSTIFTSKDTHETTTKSSTIGARVGYVF